MLHCYYAGETACTVWSMLARWTFVWSPRRRGFPLQTRRTLVKPVASVTTELVPLPSLPPSVLCWLPTRATRYLWALHSIFRKTNANTRLLQTPTLRPRAQSQILPPYHHENTFCIEQPGRIQNTWRNIQVLVCVLVCCCGSWCSCCTSSTRYQRPNASLAHKTVVGGKAASLAIRRLGQCVERVVLVRLLRA